MAPEGFVWRVPALVKRVVDGDTVILHQLDLGFWHGHAALEGQEERVRLLDLWCAERNTAAGKLAKAHAETLLPPGTEVLYSSIEWKRTLERVIGAVELPDGRDFATAMIDAGHGTRDRPPKWAASTLVSPQPDGPDPYREFP